MAKYLHWLNENMEFVLGLFWASIGIAFMFIGKDVLGTVQMGIGFMYFTADKIIKLIKGIR